MKITIHIEGRGRRSARLPYQGAEHVLMAGACPACGADGPALFGDRPEQGHDRYTATAVHVGADCGAAIGTMVVEFDTLFGIEEDERVLNGRPRVY